jgi:hypothetical protein
MRVTQAVNAMVPFARNDDRWLGSRVLCRSRSSLVTCYGGRVRSITNAAAYQTLRHTKRCGIPNAAANQMLRHTKCCKLMPTGFLQLLLLRRLLLSCGHCFGGCLHLLSTSQTKCCEMMPIGFAAAAL